MPNASELVRSEYSKFLLLLLKLLYYYFHSIVVCCYQTAKAHTLCIYVYFESCCSNNNLLGQSYTKLIFLIFKDVHHVKKSNLTSNQPELCFYISKIRIDGRVTKLPDDEAAEYFKTRPRPSQIGACVSNQSTVISSRQVRNFLIFPLCFYLFII